jgi:hypothetical protein
VNDFNDYLLFFQSFMFLISQAAGQAKIMQKMLRQPPVLTGTMPT